MRVLLGKDLRLFCGRAQYRLYLVLLLATMAFGTWVGISRHQEQVESNQNWQARHDEYLKEIGFYASLAGPGQIQMLPPSPMAIFARGADELITTPFITRLWARPTLAYRRVQGPIESFILHLDLATLILVLVSLFAIYLAHNVLRDELINRTFRTNLVFNVPPARIVLSKYLAALIATCGPLVLMSAACVAATALIVGLGGEHLLRAAIMVGVFVIYISFWLAAIFIIQVFTASRLTSLAIGLVLWIALTLVAPQAILTYQSYVSPLNNDVRYFQARRKAFDQVRQRYLAFRVGRGKRLTSGGNEAFFISQAVIEQLVNAGVQEAEYGNLERYADRLSRGFSLIHLSLFYSTSHVVNELANTGVGDYLNFRRQMGSYFNYFSKQMAKPALARWAGLWLPPDKRFAPYNEMAPRSTAPPLSELRKLDRTFHRVPLGTTLQRIVRPVVSLTLLTLLTLAFLVLVVPRRLLRTGIS